ncbi:MAG: pyruvate synthase subunit porC [Thermoproteota archaeon]|nr:MAG: pyruvate synthase subunit porC [Candidatus Korarchaeota archaeon]
MIEVRWHGRGGQGVWTASNLLAMAALKEGKYVQSFPTFGPERMGAPIMAFTRISDEPIELHCSVYEPDIVVVLDPTLLGPGIIEGLKPNGFIIANFPRELDELIKVLGISKGQYKVYAVNATEVAVKILKRGITNTAMLGALVKATGIVKLESVFDVIKERFSGVIAERNIEVVKVTYESTKGG